jgi:hypothetical protein
MYEGPDGVHKISVATWIGRGLLITVAAVLVAISTGAIKLPLGSASNQSGVGVSLTAERSAADQRWASAMCTGVLDWKNEIKRDGTSLNLGFGAVARIQDAIASTNHMLSDLHKLGLPPGAQSGPARAQTMQLRTELESRLHEIEGVAGSVAGGDFGAIGSLVGDLENDTGLGKQLGKELGHVVSVDLGLSLVETRACRELVGSPI